MRRSAALGVVLGLAILPGPAPAQEVAPPTWLGVTFETPAARLRDSLGDPLRLTRLPDEYTGAEATAAAGAPPQRKARYLLSAPNRMLYLIVSERHGAVVGIEGFSPQPLSEEVAEIAPDPSGVRLGATEATVLRVHPDARRIPGESDLVVSVSRRYVAAYTLAGGRATAILWFARPDTDPPGDGPPLTEPAGDSPATAILVNAKNENEGIRWETIWALFHPCAASTRWSKTQVATSHADGRAYDAVSYSCPATGTTRKVFFDITSFFGKL
jgi:hypothetical protein